MSKKRHGSIRPWCCGKKRKCNQVYGVEAYDSNPIFCKPGYGCKKVKSAQVPAQIMELQIPID